MLSMLVPRDAIAEYLHYHRPVEPVTTNARDHIIEQCVTYGISLVVIDSLGEAFGLQSINEDLDAEVGPYLRLMFRPIAEAGPAILLIDHSTKSKDNPLYPSGSKRKRAAITGASYFISSDSPPVKPTGAEPTEGRLKVTCAKDRHGTYRQREHIATVSVVSYPDGAMSCKVWPADIEQDRTAGVLLASRAAVRAAKDANRPLSQTALIEAMRERHKARRESLIAGIEDAVASGYLREVPGPRNARHFHYNHLSEVPDVA